MKKVFHLYLADTGTRHPDKKVGRAPAHGYDWFGLGGVLISKTDQQSFYNNYSVFVQKWNLDSPLHSSEIRAKSDGFAFLGLLSELEQKNFYEDLYQLMAAAPVLGIACIVDRPGYNYRYLEKYGRQRWSLCKTAFPIVIERAAKFAQENGAQLRVYLEKSDKKTDRIMREYYDEMRNNGTPFACATSEKYQPLSSSELHEILYEFRVTGKTNPLMQLADLYLWPMAIGGYNSSNLPYVRLKEDKKLMDCVLTEEDIPHKGIKYSCWDLVQKYTGKS